jgi:TonB family protein
MRKIIFFFLLFTEVLFAQKLNNKIVYLDSLFIETSQDNQVYYRIVKDYHVEKKEYLFTQYYNSDKIESKGNSLNKDFFLRNGAISSFFENGNQKSVINYEEGYKIGKCEFWYENGIKKLEGEYFLVENKEKKIESILKINNFWDIENNQKVSNGIGNYIDDENLINDSKNNSISSGSILNGLKQGTWIGSNKKYKYSFEESYNEGILISGISTDENGQKYNYNVINVNPEPKGGISAFYNFIAKNYYQPENLKVSGKVITSFVVNAQGKITNIKTIRSLQTEADEEAIRVIKKHNDFIPGLSRGIKVDNTYTIPISLKAY